MDRDELGGTLLKTALLIFGGFIGIVVGAWVYSFICGYPQYTYHDSSRAHPYQKNCMAFGKDDDLKMIGHTLETLPEPVEQHLQSDQLTIRWDGGECIVNLDQATQRVLNIESHALSGVQWKPEAR